jgi:hypothetical protein
MRWFHTIIGKSMAQPFMETETGMRAVFNGTEIASAVKVCRSCAEPVSLHLTHCPWCSITEDDALVAAQGNPLRMLDHHGMLEGYYQGLEELARARDTR